MDNQKIPQIVHWLTHVKLTDGKADGRLPWGDPPSNLHPLEPTTRSAAAQSPLLQQATNQHHYTMTVPPKPEPIFGYEWQLAYVASVFGQGGSGGCVPMSFDEKHSFVHRHGPIDDSENLGYQRYGTLPAAPPDTKADAPSEDDEEVSTVVLAVPKRLARLRPSGP